MENLLESLKQIQIILEHADDILNDYPNLGSGHDVPEIQVEYYIESAFLHTLILLEKLNLSSTYEEFKAIYDKARKEGFTETSMGIVQPHLLWSSKIFNYLEAIGNSYNIRLSKVVTKDLISILRSTLYSITDKKVFKEPPSDEREVHTRIEAVLKCFFPNLKHKPTITKPIKNFEPDTGLPSVKTLIEYKFISNQDDAKRVSDQVLADTRGYYSRDWEKFIYVIYETLRIKPEIEWVHMLKECGVPRNTQIIVLSGEPITHRQEKKSVNV